VRLPGVEVLGSFLPVAGPAIASGIPARVTTIPGATVERWQPRLLSDVLTAQAGISTYDDLGSPFKTTLVARGFTSSPVVGLPQGLSVFLDGIPINEPDARQVNFDLLPADHLRGVELLTGTASLLGPNSIGGAVNLVTRRGTGDLQGDVRISAGSFASYSAEASAGGETGGWSYYAGGGYHTERGWRDETGAEQLNALVNLGRYGPRRGLALQAFVARSNAETAGSLPLSIYRIDPAANLTAGDFEDLGQLHVALSGYSGLGAGRGSFNLYLGAHAAERFNVNQINDPDVRSISENRTLGANADWRVVRSAGTDVLGLRLGAGATANRTDFRIFAERIDPGMTTHVPSRSRSDPPSTASSRTSRRRAARAWNWSPGCCSGAGTLPSWTMRTRAPRSRWATSSCSASARRPVGERTRSSRAIGSLWSRPTRSGPARICSCRGASRWG
jgi:hypothetical protein